MKLPHDIADIKNCIYLLTSPTGHKAYVGQAAELAQRLRQHKHVANYPETAGLEDGPSRGAFRPLYKALRKYGWDSFTLTVLHRDVQDQAELSRLEMDEIALRGTFGAKGYNATVGGEGVRGWKMPTDIVAQTVAKRAAWTPEQKKHFSDAKKAAVARRTPEERVALTAKFKAAQLDLSPERQEQRKERIRTTVASEGVEARAARSTACSRAAKIGAEAAAAGRLPGKTAQRMETVTRYCLARDRKRAMKAANGKPDSIALVERMFAADTVWQAQHAAEVKAAREGALKTRKDPKIRKRAAERRRETIAALEAEGAKPHSEKMREWWAAEGKELVAQRAAGAAASAAAACEV